MAVYPTRSESRPSNGCLSSIGGGILFLIAALSFVIGCYAIAIGLEQQSVAALKWSALFLLVSAVLGWLAYQSSQKLRFQLIQASLEAPMGLQQSSPERIVPTTDLLAVIALPIAAISLAVHVGRRGNVNQEAEAGRFLITLASCLLVPTALLVLHELGHLLMAWLMRFRPVELNIGNGKPWLQRRLGNLDIILRFRFQQGFVICLPLRAEGYRWKRFWISAGGILMELTCLLICLIIALQARPAPERYFAGVIGMMLVLHLLRSRHSTQHMIDGQPMWNDAYRLRDYWKGEPLSVQDEMAKSWTFWVMRLWSVRKDPARAWAGLHEFEQLLPQHVKTLEVKRYFLTEEERWKEAAEVTKVLLLATSTTDREQRLSLMASWSHSMSLSGAAAIAREGLDEMLCSLEDDISRVQVLDIFASSILADRGRSALLVTEALLRIEQAILLDSHSITLLGTKGALLVELHRETEAEPLLERVLELTASDTDRAICAIYLGIIAKRSDDVERQLHFEKLGTENPVFATMLWLPERAEELTEAI